MANWITTQVASKILGISQRRVQILVKKGVIEVKKEGKKLKVNITSEILEKYGKNEIELPEDFNEAQKRYVLIRFQAVDMLRAGLKVKEIAKHLGIGRRTIYYWIQKGLIENYENEGIEGLINKESAYRGKFRSLTEEQIRIIEGYKLKYPRASEAALYRLIRNDFKEWKLPHLRTVRKIFANISYTQKVLAKEGDFGFESKCVHRQRRAPEPFPNMQWEADEIILDVLVRNENGKELTPRMILIIDSCTRGIPGFAISFRADSRLLDRAFLNAVLTKHNKPFCGIPNKILVDNGKIFISKHIKRVWSDLGTEYKPLKIKSPWAKGICERAARTIQENCLPFLDGYKGNRVSNRPPKEKIKPISMEVLEKALSKTITEYHHRKHSTLGMSPVERWQKAEIEAFKAKVPEEKELELLLLYEIERTVTKEGIRIFNHNYWSDKFFNLLKQKVIVKYNPDDLKQIIIYHKNEFICFAEMDKHLLDEINIDTVKERQKEAKESKKAQKILNRQRIKEMTQAKESVKRLKEETFQEIEPELITAFTGVRKDLKKIKEEGKKEKFKLIKNEPEKKNKLIKYAYQAKKGIK